MPTNAMPTDAVPTTRKELLWAAAVFAVVTLAFAYPVFGGAYLVNPNSDQFIGGYAVRTFGAAYWHATGHYPQWNPYLFGGMPYIGSVNGDLFYPPSVLFRALMRPDLAVSWLFIVHEFLAGFFAYVFLRAWGLGFFGALIGGLAYMMGGPIASYVSPGHDGKLYVSALFPLMSWAVIRGMRDARPWAWPVLLLITGFGILTPHPQLMQYAMLGTFAVALYVAFWDPATRSIDRGVMLRRFGLALGCMAVGLLIGAIQFAPVLEYVRYSPRSGGGNAMQRGYEFSASYSMPPEELFGAYLPEFFGVLENYWGRTGIHFQSDYLGAVVLVLAGAAFFSARRAQLWFWVTVVAVTVLFWVVGGFLPFFHVVYVLVPGTKYFRAPATMFFLTAFAIAALAGQGFEAVAERRVRPMYLIVWSAVAVLITVLAAAGGLTNVAESLAGPERFEAVLNNVTALTFGAVRAMVGVLLAAAIIVFAQRDRLTPSLAGWALAALLAVDLWSEERMYWMWSAPASVVYASNPAIDYVRKQPQPGRVMAVQTSRTPGPRDPEFDGDALMIHGIRQVVGYHSDELRTYDLLIDKAQGSRQALNPKVWSLLNVQYLYTDADSIPLPGIQRLVGPVRNASGSTVYLYRVPGDNPAAWVVPVAVKAPDDQTLATVRDPRFPPLQAAIFDTAAQVPVAKNLTTLPAPLGITATATRYDPGHITVQLSAPAPAGATLVVSENHYPGWTATVDGKPAVTARADFTLIGVPLAAGSRTIDLVFHDPAFPIGVWITFLTTAAALAWLAVALSFTARARPA
jgi:Bacterial membrane protein YfhO